MAENARRFTVSSFLGNAAAKFYWRPTIPEALFPKTVKRRNRQRFITKYQLVVCFSRFETD